MKKKTILISAVIAAATIIAFKHIFNKEEEEYFLNENYPFGRKEQRRTGIKRIEFHVDYYTTKK